MIDGVIPRVTVDLLKINAKAFRQLSDFLELSRNAQVGFSKVPYVLANYVRTVALGIDAHEHDAGQGREACLGQLLSGTRQDLHCQRADIGAMGEAKKDEVPLAGKDFGPDRVAVMIEQREFRQLSRCGQDGCRSRYRRWRHDSVRRPRA